MGKVLMKIKNLVIKNKLLKKGIIFLMIIFMCLYCLAFIMKDRANNNLSRYICKEFVNGPHNITALVVNKITGRNMMSYKSQVSALNNKNEAVNDDNNVETEVLKIENLNKTENIEKPLGLNLIESLELELIKQKEIEKMLIDELNSGDYTFDNPYVVLDPYDESPLTALILFQTDKPVKIGIDILGNKELSTISFMFETKGYSTTHIVPVFGLYPNKENKVIITSKDENGALKQKEMYIKTEELAKDLKDLEFIAYLPDSQKYQKGFNFSYVGVNHVSVKSAFDAYGDIRWYFKSIYTSTTNYNKMASIFLHIGSYHNGDALILEKNLLGKILSIYYTSYGNHHEIYLTNDLLYLGGSNADGTVEDVVIALDRITGEEVVVLDYKKILSRSRVASYFHNNIDWMHLNAILEHNLDIIISSNIQSTVMKTDKNGHIKWILSEPYGYLNAWKNKILAPLGKEFEYSYNQHAPMILPDYDKNPDTIDILLFDNGISRNFSKGQEYKKNNKYSRIVHYRINEKKMTVEQIWQYGKERPELYSPWRGDADLLDNGNILGVFQRDREWDSPQKESDTVYLEVDREKNVVWECVAHSRLENNRHLEYRVERLEIYSESANDIKLGVPTKNLIPKEVYEKFGLTKETLK